MAVVSVMNGWTCEGCGVNRNTTNEVWNDCKCGELKELAEEETKCLSK